MKFKIGLGVRAVILMVFLIAATFLLGNDAEVFWKWWFCLLVLGFGFWPLGQALCGNFDDKGWIISKVLGVTGTGFMVWLLTCCKITKFNSTTCFVISIICVALNWFIWFFFKRSKEQRGMSQEQILAAFDGELILLLFFLAWTYVAGFRPAAYGTEKFMDFGFMMSMMRSEVLPAPDMWYAGKTLNYYYGGQYFAVFLTKLTQTEVAQTYNLMRTMVAGFAFALPFVLVRQMIWDFHTARNWRKTNSANIAGVFAGAGVSLAGNMHYVVVGKVLPWIRKIFHLSESEYTYWFPNSTRYIGYYPEGNDKTIHEFPSYSFVLGDLHAHVVNVFFVLTLICIMYSMVKKCQKTYHDVEACELNRKFIVKQVFADSYIWTFAFFIGLFNWTNFWDFVIYFVMGGFAVIYCNYLKFAKLEDKKEAAKKTAIVSACHAVWVLVLSSIFALPFTLQFDSMAAGIGIAFNHSRPYQWWLIWGVQVVMSVLFFVGIFFAWKRKEEVISFVDWFGIILGVSALGLILIPELVYVRDIYEAGYARANTMFKLTYQAFMMFGILMAYMFIRMWMLKKQYIIKTIMMVCFVCFAGTCCYVVTAVTSWFGEVQDPEKYQGLDATAFLDKQFMSDVKAIRWLNENVEGNPVIVEAQGDSYTDYERVSAMTGLPTIAGWYVHQWLWRNDLEDLNYRISVLETIYSSKDEATIRELLADYNVEYIYVGYLERQKYDLNEEMLRSLGKIVYEYPSAKTFIVQVEN